MTAATPKTIVPVLHFSVLLPTAHRLSFFAKRPVNRPIIVVSALSSRIFHFIFFLRTGSSFQQLLVIAQKTSLAIYLLALL